MESLTTADLRRHITPRILAFVEHAKIHFGVEEVAVVHDLSLGGETRAVPVGQVRDAEPLRDHLDTARLMLRAPGTLRFWFALVRADGLDARCSWVSVP